VVLAAAVGVGVLLGLLAGGSVRGLSRLTLRFESVLLAVLVAQLLLPFLRLQGRAAALAFWVWLGTFPVLIAIAVANRRVPGMPVIAAGLVCNAIVIAVNGAMPVAPLAAAATGSAIPAIATGDFVHAVAGSATRLTWLGDVLPVPGPPGWRALASPGDVLLAVGAAVVVAIGMSDRREPSPG
jgi:hypothetical protein